MYTFETLNFCGPNPYLSSTNGFQALHGLKFSWGFNLGPHSDLHLNFGESNPLFEGCNWISSSYWYWFGFKVYLDPYDDHLHFNYFEFLSFVGSYLNSIGQVGVILIFKPFYVCIVIWMVQFDFLGFYGCEFDFQNHSTSVPYHLGDPIWPHWVIWMWF